MDSLVNYGSEDENEFEDSGNYPETRRDHEGPQRKEQVSRTPPPHQPLRRDDDTNYDDVTMDMSEDSFSDSDSPQQDNQKRGSPTTPYSSSSTEGGRHRDKRSPERNHRGRDRDTYQRDDHRDNRRDSYRDDRRKSPPAPAPQRRGLLGDRPGDPNTLIGATNNSFNPRSSSNQGQPADSPRPGGLGSNSRYGNRPRSGGGGLGSNSGLGGGGLGSNNGSLGGGLGSNSVLGSVPNSCLGSSSGLGTGGLGQPQALMDVRPFGGNPPPVVTSPHRDEDKLGYGSKSKEREHSNRYDKDGSVDKKDKDSERGDRKVRDSGERDKDRYGERERDKDRDRHNDRDRDRDRDRHSDRDKDRHSDRDRRYHDDKRSSNSERRRDRSRSRERDRDRRTHSSRSGDSSRRSNSQEKRAKKSHSREKSPNSGEYKPSYKVSKKLQAMEKMGLQIKTPDGSMATAQMLMQRSLDEQVEKVKIVTGIELPKYYNPAVMNPLKYAEQIQKRKLLWGNKAKETETVQPGEGCSQSKANPVNKWQGAKFAQDNDGKVASKFLRLMGVKDPAVVQTPQQTEPSGDIVKKQEEMFEAMQAQYDVARATTHTMRGVGLGFSSLHRQY